MKSSNIIRTVLGDIAPLSLGRLDYHEHLFQRSPLLPDDVLSDEALSGQEALRLRNAGVDATIEATPAGLGRDVEATARISSSSGLHIVHVTGAHHSGHYPLDYPLLKLSIDQLAERFTNDVTLGFQIPSGQEARTDSGIPIRAGMVKAGIRYWSINAFEMRVLKAVSLTQLATGCPVMIHLEYGSASHEILDILAGHGVPANRVVLAHIDRNLDPELHVSLAEKGAYLGYDGMARHRESPDSAILQCLRSVVDAGQSERIVIGGDVARSSRYRSYGGLPGLEYLPLRFLPRLLATVGDDAYHRIVVTNGAELLAMPPDKPSS